MHRYISVPGSMSYQLASKPGTRKPLIRILCVSVILVLALLIWNPLRAAIGSHGSRRSILLWPVVARKLNIIGDKLYTHNRRAEECRLIKNASDKCAFVQANCTAEESGIFPYLQLYFCSLSRVKPLAVIILVIWLCLLFSTIGIAASDFFCINLSTISNILGMSESMAGVTFLAFGNGSPDVFSTFAAMSTHSGSLAVGELIGAAGFITAVVVGSMALIRPFKVSKRSFVRDLCFFIVAASFSLVFLADGHLHLWECTVMVGFYIFYVIFVVVWHSYMNRRRRKGARESLARGQFVGASFEESGTHDEAEERAERNTGGGEHSTNLKAVSPLLLQVPVDAGITDRDEDVDDEVQDRWMAQVRGNMRLNRPPARSRRNTLNPIRPSLVGALEFRAILSSLAKAQNTPIPHTLMRRHSDDASLVLSQQQPFNSAAVSHSRCVDNLHGGLDSLDSEPASKFSRARAVSVNDTNGSLPVSFGRYRSEIPTTDFSLPTLPNSAVPQPTEPSSSSPYSNIAHTHPNTAFLQPGITADSVNDPSTRPIIQLSSRLALPLDSHSGFGNYTSGEGSLTAQGHFDFRTESQWRNKTKLPTGIDSSPVTTFPPYYDDETFLPPSRPLSRRTRSSSIGPTFALGKMQKSVSWWPYRALPPPQVIGSILFPTLDSWGDKNIWGKLLAIAAVPSVLLLVVTLPVVELESNDGDPMPSTNDVNLSNTHGTCSPLANPLVIISRPTSLNGDGIGDIDQPYTRITQHNQYPSILINGDNYHSRQEVEDGSLALAAESLPNFENQSENTIHSESLCPVPQNSTKAVDEIPLSPRSWNRWLVSTQVFITPQFLLLVVWLSSDKIQSQISLFRTSIYTLVVSLAIFAVVLLTTNEAKPPRYRFLICFVGFIVSIAWISTIADEVVAVLKALGVIFNISDAILGLTIFAVGNSLGDLVANVTVARLGYPMMALSACFGGPMLNILLGIGISGLYMMIRDGNGRHDRHPTRPVKYKAFQIEVDNTLILSGATLLVTLISLLIAVPLNNWRIDRKIGWGLIILWTISTFSNVILEIAS